ncbi:MAG: GumC family protein [Ruegeria sp.]|uniref:GumC family protein n=1 Tax=Ruegeria sp. TaxID=1879320 RepID=UPI00349EF82F
MKPSIEDLVERAGFSGLRAILKRNAILIVSILVISMSMGYLVVQTAEREYTATTALVFESRRANVGYDALASGRRDVSFSYILTEIEVLRSRDFAEEIVRNLSLDEDPGYLSPETDTIGEQDTTFDAATTKLLENYAISRFWQSLGLGIQVNDTDPARAALIANEIVQTYIDQTLALQLQSILRSMGLVQNELTSLDTEIATTEVRLSDLIRLNDLDDTLVRRQLLSDLQRAQVRLEYLKETGQTSDRIATVEGQIDDLNAALARRSNAEQTRKTLERQLEDLYNRHAFMSNKVSELRAQMALTTPLARQISVAQVPKRPSRPNRNTLLAASFVSGLALSFVAALFRESMDRRIFLGRSSLLEAGLRYTIRFPAVPGRHRRSLERLVAQITRRRRPSVAAEAARHILSVMDNRFSDTECLVLGLTATDENDDHGFLAACLAITAANDGNRVLLIDLGDSKNERSIKIAPGDRSERTLAELFGDVAVMKRETILNHLADGVDFVFPAADSVPPLDLFNQSGVVDTTNWLWEHYDIAILVAPPASRRAVVGRILPLVDQMLLIVRDKHSDLDAVAKSTAALEQLGIDPFTIVNCG